MNRLEMIKTKDNLIRIILAILILLLVVISREDKILKLQEIEYNEARKQLEKVVEDSYIEDTLDAIILKDNIEQNIENASVSKKEGFPIDTVIDGFEFEIEQNGNINDKQENSEETPEIGNDTVESNNIIENSIIDNNITNNNTINNNTIEEPIEPDKNPEEDDPSQDPIPEEEGIIKYNDETKTYNGIHISTTKEGIVTITGKTTQQLFIKISNNVQIANNVNLFSKWEEEGILIEKGKTIKMQTNIIDNKIINGRVNIAFRTQSNQAIGVMELGTEQKTYNTFLDENIIANYIYIAQNTEIENLKFQLKITEEQSNNLLVLKNDSKTLEGIQCTTEESGKVILNGVSTSRLFIKISNGIDMVIDGNQNSELAKTEPIIIEENKNIALAIQELEGSCNTTASNQEFNVVLKNSNGNIVANCKLKNNIFYQQLNTQNNITMAYIFISEGVTLQNYTIKPIVNYTN